MKRVGLLALLFPIFFSAAPARAQEYFYNDGVFVGLGAQASIMRREKDIAYGFKGFCDPTPICVPLVPPLKATSINDVAPSPTLTVGYKFDEKNSLSLTGDFAHYSVSRGTDVAPDFTTIAVDGIGSEHIPGTVTSVDINWKSEVFNVALEYQRRLLAARLGGLLGQLGVKYRNERQTFHAVATESGVTALFGKPFDNYRETLNEHLFGPYAGLKMSVKPEESSNLSFHLKGNVGYYFKWANLDARNRYFNGNHFSQDDRANNGTIFVTAGASIAYAFTKNWLLDLGYEFNWIDAVAHIANAHVSKQGVPSRIVDSSLFSHNPGIKLIYKFD